RISDVIAIEDVEVLAMDTHFRTRIWRYPRIAARVFFNLSTMLLDRLQGQLQRAPEGESGHYVQEKERTGEAV
ncbi:MAG: hypothetical protein ACRERD_02310, partial [Candidatus Binatia bacterium]